VKRNCQDKTEPSEQGVSIPRAPLWQVPRARVEHCVCFVVYPGFQLQELHGLAMVFREATTLSSSGVDYRLEYMSDSGGAISSSCGLAIVTKPLDAIHVDTVLVMVGSLSTEATIDHPAVAAISTCEALKGRVTRIGGVFKGASCYKPNSADDYVWTSAGITAGLDMALAMVGEDNGAELSRVVAQSLAVYRPSFGRQSQASALSDA
jgi:transcriptional regulator GlxA family with amidase domain